jgi:phenylpropionate dioxygenase-like ring-hydroxylating dioxygenase large terminal subunit
VTLAVAANPGPAPNWAINWARQWYSVAFLEDLEGKAPFPVTVLGKTLVVWADKQVGRTYPRRL